MLHYQLLSTRAMVSAIVIGLGRSRWGRGGSGGGGMNWSVRPHMSPHLLQPPRCSTSGNSEVSTTDSAAGCGMNWTVRRPRGRRKRHGRRGGNMAKVAQNETKKRTFPLPFSLFSLSSIALSPAPKICRHISHSDDLGTMRGAVQALCVLAIAVIAVPTAEPKPPLTTAQLVRSLRKDRYAIVPAHDLW